ncbi:hypothetical protein EZV62_010472 [Acer yangbiense]|uniref:SWIM-type domain-containing protein n=1 Tax=Acer yangbiense TaxID=1000413 RepID=A0A5C7I392_9ROSI|nr:hypothetical protein EZV62_010472 [Acer yangbiense]
MIAAGNIEYELLCVSGGYAMKLREYNCQCGSWQVSGIPCCHAMATISHYCGRAAVKDKVAEFIHSSLTKSAYMQTYVGMIHPIQDQKKVARSSSLHTDSRTHIAYQSTTSHCSTWQALEAVMVEHLKPFYKLTKFFLGTKYPTANLVFPMICKVRETMNGWLNSRYSEIQAMARGSVSLLSVGTWLVVAQELLSFVFGVL